MRCCSGSALPPEEALSAQLAHFAVEDELIQGLVLRLGLESREVLRVEFGVLHTCAGSGNRRFELIALLRLVRRNGRGTGAVLHGVLGITAVGKAHGRVLANLAADVLDRVLISNFSHGGFSG